MNSRGGDSRGGPRAGAASGRGPLEIRIAAAGARLVLLWPDATETAVDAAALRRACRCAACTARRAVGEEGTVPDNIVIVDLATVGGYGVNLVFSDGHARGIFPWSLIRAAAEPSAVSSPAASSSGGAPE